MNRNSYRAVSFAVAATICGALPVAWPEKYDLAAKRPELIAELRKLAGDHQKTVIQVKNQIATRTPSKGSRP
jgi:hypothetical protein